MSITTLTTALLLGIFFTSLGHWVISRSSTPTGKNIGMVLFWPGALVLSWTVVLGILKALFELGLLLIEKMFH